MMKEVNKFFKKGNNLLGVQLISLAVFLYLLVGADISRTGIFGSSYVISILLIVLGVVLIIIPEPATTITGVLMVAGGLLMIYGTAILQKLANQYGMMFWIVLAIFIFIILKLMRRI